MINQFFKIILRNKTKNSLLLLQFLLSFFALYMLATQSISIVNSFTTPLGFDKDNLIAGQIRGIFSVRTEKEFKDVYPYMKQAMEEIRLLDYVEHAGYMRIYPYSNNNSNTNGNKINTITPQALQAMGLTHLSGTPFKVEDQFKPNSDFVLINRKADEHYKEVRDFTNLLGENFNQVMQSSDTVKVDDVYKVLGTFEDFRIHGQFRGFDFDRVALFLGHFDNENYFKEDNNWNDIGNNSSFVVRTNGSHPNTVVMKKVSEIYKKYLPEKTTNVYSVAQLHEDSSRRPVRSFMVLLFICLVLTFVIVIGIIAITKENISKRFKEIGIRMALGSTDRQVQITFLGELVLLAVTASLISGLSIFLLDEYNIASFTVGYLEYLVTFILLLIVIVSCVYAPIKKASSMKPNLALHYE